MTTNTLHGLELLLHDAEVRTVRGENDRLTVVLSAAPLRWREDPGAGPWRSGFGAGLQLELQGVAEFPDRAGALGRVSRGELRLNGQRWPLRLPLSVHGEVHLALDFSNGTLWAARAGQLRCVPPPGLQPHPSYAC